MDHRLRALAHRVIVLVPLKRVMGVVNYKLIQMPKKYFTSFPKRDFVFGSSLVYLISPDHRLNAFACTLHVSTF